MRRGEGVVQTADHRLLDLRAAEAIGGRGEQVEVERSGSRSRLRRWIAKISRRTSSGGRSTKKISSKRPLRSSSGGSASMSFAVATRKTGARVLLHPGQQRAEHALATGRRRCCGSRRRRRPSRSRRSRG
jgi:hypothetical protein